MKKNNYIYFLNFLIIFLIGCSFVLFNDLTKKENLNHVNQNNQINVTDAATVTVSANIYKVYGTSSSSNLGTKFQIRFNTYKSNNEDIHDYEIKENISSTGSYSSNLTSWWREKQRSFRISFYQAGNNSDFYLDYFDSGLIDIEYISGSLTGGSYGNELSNTPIPVGGGILYTKLITYENIKSAPADDEGYNFGNISIYWKFECVLNDNGGTNGSGKVQYGTYSKNMSSIDKPTRKGYEFKGYYTSKTGGDQVINSDLKWVLDIDSCKPMTIYAQWTPITYSISYNLDGGTKGNNAPTIGTFDSALTISNPTKKGYVFVGWTASGLDTSTAYYGSTKWSNGSTKVTATSFKNLRSTNGTITLTANWTPITYSISYNLAGGTKGSNAPSTANYDNAITISNPTKAGYGFAGWTASGLDTSTAYYGSTKWSNASTKVTATSFKNLRSTSGTVTLTANWTPYQLTVQYHDGKGSDLSSINYDYESSKNVDLITYEKQGYIFNGWQIDKIGNLLNGTQNFSNHIQTSSAKIHLYPNITPIKYQINFDKNSNQATGTMLNQKFTYDIEQSLNLNQYTRPGYKFLGWSISANSNEIAYSNGKKVKNLHNEQDGQITLYAVWQLEQYDLTINANGGKYNGEGIYTKKDINSKSLLFLSTPTREGYVFDGWEVSSGNAEIQLSQYYLSSKNFNGTSDYQALGRTYMYEQNITINLFVYMDNWSDFVTSNRRFISCTESGGWNIEANGLNISAAFYQKSSGYNNVNTNVAWSSLSQGWHMFTLCFDKDYAIVYLDGNQIGKSTKWNNVIGYNSTNGIFLGSEATPSATTPNNQYFKGNLQNVVFYNNYITGIIDLSNSTFSTLNNKENIYSCIMGTQNCTLKAKWKRTTISDMINSDSYEEGTIEISTTEDLLKLAVTLEKGDIGNGFTFVQTNNIDLKDVDWLPMGRLHNFSGTYDGQGYKITNLEVFSNQNTNKEYIQNFGGLFASINGGTVKNLIVESNEIQGNTAGIIVGSASVNANIENCIVSGIVNGTTIGSIAGAGGQIKNCLALNTVKGESNQTALLNFSTGTAINNCIYYNTNSNKGFYTGETIDYSKWAYINSYPMPMEIVWYPKTLTENDLTNLNIKKQSEFK